MTTLEAYTLLEEYRAQCRQTMFFRNIQDGFRAKGEWNAAGCVAAERNESKSLVKEADLEDQLVKLLTRKKG